MTDVRSYAVLPCPDLDEALVFYGQLGFEVTFLQRRPYPCAVVAREGLQIHLAGIDGFDPAGSYASVIITVPDPAEWHAAFAEGLRRGRGKVPVGGIPRLLPVRRKAGTATGFSVVDVGGNWLRFYRTGAQEDDPAPRAGLGRAIDVAARQADSRGDDVQALAVLDAALLRHPDAPAEIRAEAGAFRAELRERLAGSRRSDPAVT